MRHFGDPPDCANIPPGAAPADRVPGQVHCTLDKISGKILAQTALLMYS
jgi:hypothetical protein